MYWDEAKAKLREQYTIAPVDLAGNKTEIWYNLQKIVSEIKRYSHIFLGCRVVDVRFTSNGQMTIADVTGPAATTLYYRVPPYFKTNWCNIYAYIKEMGAEPLLVKLGLTSNEWLEATIDNPVINTRIIWQCFNIISKNPKYNEDYLYAIECSNMPASQCAQMKKIFLSLDSWLSGTRQLKMGFKAKEWRPMEFND